MDSEKKIPGWALKHRKKNTEILKRNNNYYLREIEGKWDPETKKTKKIVGKYLGKITPEGIIPPKYKRVSNLTSLNKDDKILRNIQILKELELGKDKSKIAKKYGITIKTINNIKSKFDKEGVKGLIHTRENKKNETIKVSSKEELNVVAELIENPEKDAKEIKKSLNVKTSLKKINSLIVPIKEHLKLKKKLLLEIEIE